MTDRSIFITYNPGVPLEQTLAVRMHTIGQVNGFEMYLPDRYNNIRNSVDPETEFRISNSKWFICFATQSLSPKVQQEIEYAYRKKRDRSKIIVIYDVSRLRKPSGPHAHFTEYPFDPSTQTPDQVLADILIGITRANEAEAAPQRRRMAEGEKKALAAFLGIGVGLLALNALAGNEPEKPAKKYAARKAPAKKAASKKAPAKKTTTKKTAAKKSPAKKTAAKGRKK